jgi:hypothetical protein
MMIEEQSPDRFIYENGELRFGPHWHPLAVAVTMGITGRIFLTEAGKSFSFGPGRPLPSASPAFEFTPDPGDAVRFIQQHDAISRLLWTKLSRAKLEIQWSENLLEIRIAEAAGLECAAVQYLARNKHWDPSEYRLEDCGPAADGLHQILFALHHDDRDSPYPGAGRSVELHLSYDSRQVTRELAGQ